MSGYPYETVYLLSFFPRVLSCRFWYLETSDVSEPPSSNIPVLQKQESILDTFTFPILDPFIIPTTNRLKMSIIESTSTPTPAHKQPLDLVKIVHYVVDIWIETYPLASSPSPSSTHKQLCTVILKILAILPGDTKVTRHIGSCFPFCDEVMDGFACLVFSREEMMKEKVEEFLMDMFSKKVLVSPFLWG